MKKSICDKCPLHRIDVCPVPAAPGITLNLQNGYCVVRRKPESCGVAAESHAKRVYYGSEKIVPDEDWTCAGKRYQPYSI